ncbi:MAG: hypothetical protein KF850_32445 [Labilithrix sp.]|nr:hypothetical protein [Labilithrix sp.]MBX3216790.1 hypothetical protein [Labilithrix sp.]
MSLPIADIVQAGRTFDPKNRTMTGDLRPAIETLFHELDAAKVDYVLVGGVALLAYIQGRNTQDIDLLVRPDELTKIDWNATVKDADFGVASYHGVNVDLLLRSNLLFDQVARERRTTTDFAGQRVRVATREGLILLKLHALPDLYRRGDLARAALFETDILMLHQGVEVDDAALLDELAAHRPPHDIAELRRILDEQRSRRRFV